MSGTQESDTVEPRWPSPPQRPLPAGACDTHTHVFGPYDRFPFLQPSSYAPPLAPSDAQAAMLRQVGVARSVLVQPAPYGSDPSALLDALRCAHGSARGVAVASGNVSDATLQGWHEAGVRGLRFTDVLDRGTGRPFAGSVSTRELSQLAPRMQALGWHAQVWAPCADIASIVRTFGEVGVPLVFEHMASAVVEHGVANAAFQEVLALVRDERIWIKLDLCRVSKAIPDYDDARPFHDALVAANPSRLLWASDWPFVRLGDAAPDVGHLIDVFCDWVPDAAVQRRIFTANPAELYGFDEEPLR